jgi:hypothetical protein
LSQHRSLELWFKEFDKEEGDTAEMARDFLVHHLALVLLAKPNLFPKFESWNGFALVLDVLDSSNQEGVARSAISLFFTAEGFDREYAFLVDRLGGLEVIGRLLKRTKSAKIEQTCIEILVVLTHKLPSKPSIEVTALTEELLKLSHSPTQSEANKWKAIRAMNALHGQRSFDKTLLERLKDGTVASIITQLLALKKAEVITGGVLYPQTIYSVAYEVDIQKASLRKLFVSLYKSYDLRC